MNITGNARCSASVTIYRRTSSSSSTECHNANNDDGKTN